MRGARGWRGVRGWLVVGVVMAAGCAKPSPRIEPVSEAAQFAARVEDADRLAARGCYLCLKEAAAAYDELLSDSSADAAVQRFSTAGASAEAVSPAATALARKALENNLMIALREIELRIPDSGARDAAHTLQKRVPSSYAAYFAALDFFSRPAQPGAFTSRQQREERVNLATELEKEWPASPMKAYFYLSAALSAAMVKELKPQLDAILDTHSDDLSLKYRMQAFLPTFSEDESRSLIGQETGFGEVHFLLGQRAVLDARLADAHRELMRARQLLPDSAAISLVLANVLMAYARYGEALTLYEAVLGPAEAGHYVLPEAQLGRARALSYLRRHTDAIAVLDELLRDLQNNPGEKYYWRAWNRLRMGDTQAAYDDTAAALKAMRNNEVYRLAGIASFGLNRLPEARGYFENALNMNGGDCDAQRYLGQIDAAERSWNPAFTRFSTAVACYDQMLARMGKELAEHEQDISGLSNGLIASLRAEIQEAEALRSLSATNATLTAKNAGIRVP